MIPIVINNRNRLTTLKKLIDDLLKIRPNEIIYILDNDSTYPPLLEFYRTKWFNLKYENVHVISMQNHGHLALWSSGFYKGLPEYFIYTDSDIELNPNMPTDYKYDMFCVLKNKAVKKVALALEINDLPDHYVFKQQVLRNEGKWWIERIDDILYKADTDTTFAMYKNFGDNTYESIRIAGNYTARHIPWYHDLSNLDEEETYYLQHLGDRQLTQYSKQHKNPELYADK